MALYKLLHLTVTRPYVMGVIIPILNEGNIGLEKSCNLPMVRAGIQTRLVALRISHFPRIASCGNLRSFWREKSKVMTGKCLRFFQQGTIALGQGGSERVETVIFPGPRISSLRSEIWSLSGILPREGKSEKSSLVGVAGLPGEFRGKPTHQA